MRRVSLALLTGALAVGIIAAPAAAKQPDMSGSNIVDTAIAVNADQTSPYYGKFDTLISLVVDLELVDALSARGQLTVFAPTDDAFQRLFDKLTPEQEAALTPAILTDIVLYHVAKGERDAAEVLGSSQIRMLNGDFAQVDSKAGTIDGAAIEFVNVPASNGIIHVVSDVLLPAPPLLLAPGPADRPIGRASSRPLGRRRAVEAAADRSGLRGVSAGRRTGAARVVHDRRVDVPPLRVIIAEDSVLIREGLARLIADFGRRRLGQGGRRPILRRGRRRIGRTSPSSTYGCRRPSATRGSARRSRPDGLSPARPSSSSASTSSASTRRAARRPRWRCRLSPEGPGGRHPRVHGRAPAGCRRRDRARSRGGRPAHGGTARGRPASRADAPRARGAGGDGGGPDECGGRGAAGHLRGRHREAHQQHLRQARPARLGERPPPRAGGPDLPGLFRGRRGVFGGVEAGGTKFVCVIGTGPDDIVDTRRIDVAGPTETLKRPSTSSGRSRRGGDWMPSDRILRPGRAAPLEPALRVHHDDAEAGLVGHRCPGPVHGGLRHARCLRHRRQRGRARGGPLGGRARVGLVRLPDPGHRDRRRDRDRWPAAVWLRPPRDGPHRRAASPRRTHEGICPFHGDCFEGMASGPAI